MKVSFLSGVKITVLPEDGDSFDYEISYTDCANEGPTVTLAVGDESVSILQGAWSEIREQIDSLFEDTDR